jgi:hypothetical protein
MPGESDLAVSTSLPSPTASEHDTNDAVAYDSGKSPPPQRYQQQRLKGEVWGCKTKPRTEDRRVVLLAAGVAVGVVEAGVVRLVDPLPEDRVEELQTQRRH